MIEATGYLLRTEELLKELVNHGWGEMIFRVTSLKDNSIKIEIFCGKAFVYFVTKDKFNGIL